MGMDGLASESQTLPLLTPFSWRLHCHSGVDAEKICHQSIQMEAVHTATLHLLQDDFTYSTINKAKQHLVPCWFSCDRLNRLRRFLSQKP